jgi:hypothetical protein
LPPAFPAAPAARAFHGRIQDEPSNCKPAHKSTRGFFAWFVADQPAATSDADLRLIDAALALPEGGLPAMARRKRPP